MVNYNFFFHKTLVIFIQSKFSIRRLAWFIMTISGPTAKGRNEWGKSSNLEFKCEMCFDSANESSSFKTAWLNDAHLFAVTRRHSVEYCQLIRSTKLTYVRAFSSIPYLQGMDRTDAHHGANPLARLHFHIMQHFATIRAVHYLRTIDFL